MKTVASTKGFMKPLFMWAGGKSKMIASYREGIGFPSENDVKAYVEPFFGGGAMLGLAQSLYPKVPYFINDINKELMNLYTWIRDDPSALEKYVNQWQKEFIEIPVVNKKQRKEYYYARRKEYWALPEDSEKSAALLFFLLKTSFNGIWQSCKDANGRFGTPVGLATQESAIYDVSRLKEWESSLKGVIISSGSYDLIDVPQKSFVFCDPPYRDSFTSYNTVFGDDDQKKLMDWCHQLSIKRGCVVWLSNRDAGDNFFMEYAKDQKMTNVKERPFPITYTAGRRKKEENSTFSAKKATELLLVWTPPE